MDAYQKYRTYYDKEAAAKPLMQHQYCLLLNPSRLTQSDFAAKLTTIWLSLYRVEKILTKPNYLIRKVDTPYTQCVDGIRLLSITPNYQVEDIQLTMDDFRPNPCLGTTGRSMKCSITLWTTYYEKVNFMTLTLTNQFPRKK